MSDHEIRLLRKALIETLADEHGINSRGFHKLEEFVSLIAPGSCDDIFEKAINANDYYLLPWQHGLS